MNQSTDYSPPVQPDHIKRQTASAERFSVGCFVKFLGVTGIVSDIVPARPQPLFQTSAVYSDATVEELDWSQPTIWFRYLDRNGVIQEASVSGELIKSLE